MANFRKRIKKKAYIESLESQISEMEDKIKDLEAKVSDLKVRNVGKIKNKTAYGIDFITFADTRTCRCLFQNLANILTRYLY